VTSNIFNQPSVRPNYYAGVVNHGVFTTAQFSASHVGLANIILGPVLQHAKDDQLQSSREKVPLLLEQLLSCPPLNASLVPAKELFHTQLQKLAINAVINPLTVAFECHNGEIFSNASRCALIQALIEEISRVICAIIPANNEIVEPVVLDRFSPTNLFKVVYEIGAKTAKNVSSMRQDVLAGRETEVDYINGYVLAQGTAFGIDCPLNSKLVEIVKEKKVVKNSQIAEIFGI
jgi:2-dehydropantoate 2-reductase